MDTTVKIPITIDPGPFSLAAAEPPRQKQLVQRKLRAAFAEDAGLPRIARCAPILKPQRLLASFPASDVLVYQPAPIDILKVTVLTSADEADRRHPPSPAVIAAMLGPPGCLELLKPHHPPAVRWVAGDRVAHKPTWKNFCPYLR